MANISGEACNCIFFESSSLVCVDVLSAGYCEEKIEQVEVRFFASRSLLLTVRVISRFFEHAFTATPEL